MDTDTLVQALAKARAEMVPPKFNKVNPHFRSKYADLSSLLSSVIPPLSAHDIVLTQTTRRGEDGVLVLVTTLRHKDGGTIESEYPVLPVKQDPQGYGSALTYARRYSISCVCAIAAEEDDDGNGGSQVPNPPPMPGPVPRPEEAKLTVSQMTIIEETLEQYEIDPVRFYTWVNKAFKVDSIGQVPASAYPKLLAKIEEVREQK